jgi:hypothetical protein
MATAEELLLSALEGDAAVQTHTRVDGEANFRIYPIVLPQNTGLPAITFQRIANPRVNSFDAGGGIDAPRIQVDAWATTRKAARELAMEVKRVVENGAAFGGWLISDAEFYEDDVDPRLYRVSQDFSLMVSES